MPRSWTCHWQYRFWRADINAEFEPIDSSGNAAFAKRRVAPGDSIYVISLNDGQLYLGGRMAVEWLVDRADAVKLFGTENLHNAEVWAVDTRKTGTPLHLHRRLAPSVTKLIKYHSSSGEEKSLFFDDDTHLNAQATRTVLDLTAESVELLDRILDLTDHLRRGSRLITVTEDMLELPAH